MSQNEKQYFVLMECGELILLRGYRNNIYILTNLIWSILNQLWCCNQFKQCLWIVFFGHWYWYSSYFRPHPYVKHTSSFLHLFLLPFFQYVYIFVYFYKCKILCIIWIYWYCTINLSLLFSFFLFSSF